MGMSVTQLLIILVIVIVLFGTKRLRNIGSDLGSAVKGFRKGMDEGADEQETAPEKLQADPEPTSPAASSTAPDMDADTKTESRPQGSDV